MPPVHRNGDLRSCNANTIASGQTSVLANGMPISVMGDANSHGLGILLATGGPGTVIIEGIPVNVVGSTAIFDFSCFTEGGAHCNPTATTGSPDVIVY